MSDIAIASICGTVCMIAGAVFFAYLINEDRKTSLAILRVFEGINETWKIENHNDD